MSGKRAPLWHLAHAALQPSGPCSLSRDKIQNEKDSKHLELLILKYNTLTLIHDVLLQGLRIVSDGLVQVLQEFAHAGHWDAKGLNKQEQLLRLQVLQRWGKKSILFCQKDKTRSQSVSQQCN